MSDEERSGPQRIFGARLRELRRARGVSQEELAARAGLDRTYVSSCERGHRNISLLNIWRLAVALGVEPPELLRPAERG
jgi:transcriptional regulator with XRE-family HTH domain